MKFILTTAAVGASLLAAPALAQSKAEGAAAPAASSKAAPAAMTEGVVRKVSKDTHKLTIKHGEIKNLDMPPMTMVFKVKDDTMLERVKPGDKIRFVVENTADGMVVTELQAAP